MLKILLCFLVTLFFTAFQLQAKPTVFEKTYFYNASDADSKLTCRAISLMEAKRLLLEEIGTYLESYTEVVNFKLTKDQITTITAGMVKTQVVDEQWNGKTYWLKARIEVDPDEIAVKIKELRNNRELDKKIAALKQENEASEERVKELKEQIASLQENLEQLNRDYQESAKIAKAVKLFDQGIQLRTQNKDQEALNVFNQSIELYPNFRAYLERGKTYLKLEQFDKALQDFTNALQSNGPPAKAHFLRGLALLRLERKEEALQSINKAITLGDREAKDWYNANKDKLNKVGKHR